MFCSGGSVEVACLGTIRTLVHRTVMHGDRGRTCTTCVVGAAAGARVLMYHAVHVLYNAVHVLYNAVHVLYNAVHVLYL